MTAIAAVIRFKRERGVKMKNFILTHVVPEEQGEPGTCCLKENKILCGAALCALAILVEVAKFLVISYLVARYKGRKARR